MQTWWKRFFGEENARAQRLHSQENSSERAVAGEAEVWPAAVAAAADVTPAGKVGELREDVVDDDIELGEGCGELVMPEAMMTRGWVVPMVEGVTGRGCGC